MLICNSSWPASHRANRRINETFPGDLQGLPHDSPAVLTVSNFSGAPDPNAGPPPAPAIGGGFHSDIEYEPMPIYVSMFLVQTAPVARTAPGGTWVSDPGAGPPLTAGNRFYRERRPLTDELHRLRTYSGQHTRQNQIPSFRVIMRLNYAHLSWSRYALQATQR